MAEPLFHLAFQFLEQEPRAAARLLEGYETEKALYFLKNTPAPTCARLLKEMSAEYSATLLSSADDQTAALWMNDIHSRSLSAMLRRMDTNNQQRLLNTLSLKKKTACQLLLSYREDMVGALAETDVLQFPADMPAEEAIKRIKRRAYREDRVAIVVDNHRVLLGELSIPRVLRANPSTCLSELTSDCPHIMSSRTVLKAAISHPLWRHSDYAVVINRQREVIGVLWHHVLRQHLAQIQSSVPSSTRTETLAVEIIHAHGESMRALVDTLFKSS